MFKKFTQDENVSSTVQLKATIGKGIKVKLQEQMPNIIPLMPVLFPKRAPLYMVKCKERISILAVDGEILFFQHYDGPWYPTLRLLHKYPNLLPHYQVDRGAIKFVLAGAHIMCPGLTSPGAKMEDVGAESAVAIMAEDKQHALGIGLTKMSTQDILKINKDIGVESVTYLNDGLWHLDTKKLAIHN